MTVTKKEVLRSNLLENRDKYLRVSDLRDLPWKRYPDSKDRDKSNLRRLINAYFQTWVKCRGLMTPDTLIRDNTTKYQGVQDEYETNKKALPQRV